MSISLSGLVKKPPTQAQAAEDLKELKGAAQESDGLTPEGQDVEAALQALAEGDDGSSGGASDSGGCSDSSSTKGAGKKPAAGAFVVKEGKTPNLQRSPAVPTGSNPNLVEGRVPNPDVVPTVTASADTAPAVAAPAVAAPAVTTPPATPAIPPDWQAGSAVVI